MKKNIIIGILVLLNVVLYWAYLTKPIQHARITYLWPRHPWVKRGPFDRDVQIWLRCHQDNKPKMDEITNVVEQFKKGKITNAEMMDRCYQIQNEGP